MKQKHSHGPKSRLVVPKWEGAQGGWSRRSGLADSNYRTWDGWQRFAVHTVLLSMPCDKPKRGKNTERVCMHVQLPHRRH